MPLKKLLHLYERSIIMICVILFSVVGMVFGVYPLAKQDIEYQKKITVLQKDIAVLTQKQSVLASLDEDTLRRNLLELVSAVPPEKSPATVLSTIDGVIAQTGATIKSIQMERPGSLATDSAKKLSAQEAKIGTFVLPFTVTADGSLEVIRSFVQTISSVRRLFRLQSLSINFSEETSVSLSADAYYLPYPQTIASVSTPVSPLSDSELQTIEKVTGIPQAYTENPTIGVPGAGEPLGKTDPFSR